MKCQILFYGKNKKNISIFRLLKVLPRVLSINVLPAETAFCEPWSNTNDCSKGRNREKKRLFLS